MINIKKNPKEMSEDVDAWRKVHVIVVTFKQCQRQELSHEMYVASYNFIYMCLFIEAIKHINSHALIFKNSNMQSKNY